jgi:hypothetical protein
MGNSIGMAYPYIKVTNTVVKIAAYLKCITCCGPLYRFTYS